MERDMQEPLKRLAAALHKAIEESPDVAQAMADIREEGFRSYLLLEVTVALSGAEEPGEPAEGGELQMGFGETTGDQGWLVEIDGGTPAEPPPLKSRIAPGDREFFESIRIRLD